VEVRKRHITCYQQLKRGEETKLPVRKTVRTAAHPRYQPSLLISIARMKANAPYNIVEESPIAVELNIIKDQIIFIHKQAVQDRIYRRLTIAGLFGTSCNRDNRRETGLLK